jgi:DNA polymerase-3 subunit epsilon
LNIERFLQLDIDDVPFTVLDVETTGINSRYERIIEFAGYRIEHGEITDSFCSFFNPSKRLDPYITLLTGITEEDLVDAPSFDSYASKLMEFLSDTIIVGHNIQFDIKFLQSEFMAVGYEDFRPVSFCTLRAAKRLFPQLKSKKLEMVRDYLNIEPGINHRAYSDALATARIFLNVKEKLRSEFSLYSLRDIIGFQYIPPKDISRIFPKTLAQTGFEIPAIPDLPGNYFFLDQSDRIIYIGKSKSLKKRLSSHLMENSAGKSKLILGHATKIRYEVTSTELMALIKEAQLIKQLNPKHNIQLKNYGNKFFLRVLLNHRAPKIELVNSFDFDGNDYFGLFLSRRKGEEIIEIAEKSFMLRSCMQKEFEKGRACFLGSIQRCLVPCEKIVDDEYKEELDKFYKFMAGENSELISDLIKKMSDYSSKMKYEQAAEIKKAIDLVLHQIHRSSLLKEPVNKANVLITVAGNGGICDYFLLLQGKVYIRNFSQSGYDRFENALEDYFENNERLDFMPTDQDYERMRIILNWTALHRESVKIFYLSEYNSAGELYKEISFNKYVQEIFEEISGEIDISKLNLNL